MITGLPGTGKTTFAGALAGKIDARHFNSDMVRSEMGKRGQYSSRDKEEVYRKLLRKTANALKKGGHVVVDATFYKEAYRRDYRELAGEMRVPINWIEITADEEVVRERTRQKRAYSEADFQVYKKIRSEYEPLDSVHLTLRSDLLDVEEMVSLAMEYLNLTTSQ